MAAPTLSHRHANGASYQQTMLRVKDPHKAVALYERFFGMRVIAVRRFPDAKFDLYFLASLRDDAVVPDPESDAAFDALWKFDRTVLELTHNYGTESDPSFAYASGNVEPYRGFGHIGFIVDDVVTFCAGLEAAGVRFQKKLTDGRMKDIAFALDEDGYWVEILPRTSSALPPPAARELAGKPSFQQSMLRVRDPAASVAFYQRHFGMSLVCARHFPDARFSLYFLGTLPEGAPLPADAASDDAWRYACSLSYSLLELTHNHGTESDAGFAGYHNGNSDPGRGFGHIGFLVDDLIAACGDMEAAGVAFTKRPHEGRMRGLAFAKDPDGYLVEIIQRGGVAALKQPAAA